MLELCCNHFDAGELIRLRFEKVKEVVKDSKVHKLIDDFIKTLKPQESEVQGFASFKVETLEDIEKIPLAFESAKKIFEKFIKTKNK